MRYECCKCDENDPCVLIYEGLAGFVPRQCPFENQGEPYGYFQPKWKQVVPVDQWALPKRSHER